jgi:DHA1 family bicyclomycin/chloramphenicol resistance-like MFS transporter
MNSSTTPSAASPSTAKSVGFTEFVVLVALLMACQALAVDAMLPALPTISHALGITDENHAQWIITAYVVGMGVGQLFCGALSDRFGRRAVLLIGLALYVVAALLVGLSSSFTSLLAWRFVHGVAAASVIVSRSMIRDLYEGRQMARVMSLTFIVFLMVPIIAPSLGQAVLLIAPWRYLFVVFAVFGSAVWAWVYVRLPETLHPEYRLTLTFSHALRSAKIVVNDPTSRYYTLAMTMTFSAIIAYVGMVQQIFDNVFHRASLMPIIFALCAASMGVTAFINSRIVERVGMRVMSQAGLLMFLAISTLHVVVVLLGHEELLTFVILQSLTLACVGVMGANFGAMAMEPMGSVAGIAASLQGCVSTAGAAVVAALIGRQFNGTTLPLAIGTVVCGLLALMFVLLAEQGRLFRPHHAGEAFSMENSVH